jgi:protein involved in polysaccharide export with SLBB domain
MSFKVYISLFVLLFISFCGSLVAQTIKQQDFSNIRIDELSDDQIKSFIATFEAKGLNEAQIDQAALAGGMSSEELQKLHVRIEHIRNPVTSLNQTSGRQSTYNQDTINNRPNSENNAGKVIEGLKSKVYGTEIFKSDISTFVPNLRLATPANYSIGPDDQIIINVSGNSTVDWELKVSPEGTINIPKVGILNLAGKTIEQSRTLIRNKLIANHYAIGRGTNLSVSLGNIRSINVILVGEVVKPGSKVLPSLATAFIALYASGGPTENGSFRQIEIIRSGNKIATLDIYDFLLHGNLKNNIQLQDQDIIHIPTYKVRAEVVGEVKHPGIFEMLPGETLSDLMRFAGGFTDQAYRSLIRVVRNTEKERKFMNIALNNFNSYQPSTGDKYYVDKIIDRFENRVSINGAVFRPGPYELTPDLTVSKLIRMAEGLREDAFQNRAQITRLNSTFQREVESFDVAKILSGQAEDIPLRREDEVTIFSIFDLKEEYSFTVQGEVQRPGTFKFAEGISLEDAIVQAGGLKESATPQRIEISSRVKNSNALSASAKTADVVLYTINQDLRAKGIILQPFDIVTVRPSSGYEVQKLVYITGEVLYPGPYTITKKDERVSDLLNRAGGFTAFAYPEGASLKRPGRPSVENNSEEAKRKIERERLIELQRLQRNSGDTINVNIQEAVARNTYIGINMPAILKAPMGKDDIFLAEGDTLNIPKQLQTVKISGQVLSPNTAVYIKNKSFKQYISSAGGFSDRSLKRRSYILYANGAVKSTKKLFVFNNYPQIKPGAEIFVPQKPEKRKLTASELIGMSTGLASLAAIVISLLR